MTTPSAECLAAMGRYELLSRTLGHDHPYTRVALQHVLELAPQSFHEYMLNMAQELGLLPHPSGYTEGGVPVYCLEDVTQHLGIQPYEAQHLIDQFIQEREAAGLGSGLIDPEYVHVTH